MEPEVDPPMMDEEPPKTAPDMRTWLLFKGLDGTGVAGTTSSRSS
jgi:hypothetical protein